MSATQSGFFSSRARRAFTSLGFCDFTVILLTDGDGADMLVPVAQICDR